MPTPEYARRDISVIICTRNRAGSLRQVLECLAGANRDGLNCEVVVVDNGGLDNTIEVAGSFTSHFPVHLLREETPGKAFALNRALDEAPLGEIIAVLDDDMSPHPDWFKSVKSICERWPDHDWFSGHSYIIWPDEVIPPWCLLPSYHGWAFSVLAGGTSEQEAPDGHWFSGNHFWFRARVLENSRRFKVGVADLLTHIEMAEPQFMLELAEEGKRGVLSPAAVCGHRVQRELLDPSVLEVRAARVGRGFSRARLQPFKRKVRQAQMFRKHPILSRLLCVASLIRWSLVRALASVHPNESNRMELRFLAIQRMAAYAEYLRVAQKHKEYRIRQTGL